MEWGVIAGAREDAPLAVTIYCHLQWRTRLLAAGDRSRGAPVQLSPVSFSVGGRSSF